MNRGWKNVLVSLAMIAILAPACRAQISPAAGADANSPGGPPSPMSEKDIWKVDPISGALTVNIPFPTTPVGGRGPRIPFGLLYNSSSTFVFEGIGTYSSGGDNEQGGFTCNEQGICYFDEDSYTTPVTTTMVYGWASPIGGPTSGPTGPWTTTGPFLVTDTNNVPNQIFTVTALNGQTSKINLSRLVAANNPENSSAVIGSATPAEQSVCRSKFVVSIRCIWRVVRCRFWERRDTRQAI